MKCHCGFNFDELPRSEPPRYQSFGVVDYDDMYAFMKAEKEFLDSDDEPTWSAASTRAARLTGDLVVCPACSRILVFFPGSERYIHYIKDSD